MPLAEQMNWSSLMEREALTGMTSHTPHACKIHGYASCVN